MNLEFELVVWGILLVFIGMSWGMWDIYKNLVEIKKIIKEISESLESMI